MINTISMRRFWFYLAIILIVLALVGSFLDYFNIVVITPHGISVWVIPLVFSLVCLMARFKVHSVISNSRLASVFSFIFILCSVAALTKVIARFSIGF